MQQELTNNNLKRNLDQPPETQNDPKKPRIAQSVLLELAQNAKAIAAPGKGILAADESTGTIGKRFEAIQLPNTEDNRRAYRELLFRTPDIGNYISGCILYEETLYQNAADGTPFVSLLKSQGILPGIKVDLGLKPLPGTPGEQACQGLTDLDVRCKKYYEKGARFAKWRAVYEIDLSKGKPSELLVETQARDLAKYAAICQNNGLVPIVEPEVLMDGTHDVQTTARVCEHVWSTVVYHLHENNIFLEGCLLKPNMVMAGQQSPQPSTTAQVAQYTLRTLLRTIPPSMAGVMFLSGGQSEEEASVNLSAINQLASSRSAPWALSFSYGRALQASTIKAWNGKSQNLAEAQNVFKERCKANSAAQLGTYSASGSGASTQSLYQVGYIY